MNEFLGGLGDLFFAVMGLATILAEFFLPDVPALARRYAAKGMTPGAATEKATKRGRLYRMLVIMPWFLVGMVISAVALWN